MEARLTPAALIAAAAFFSLGANHRTENFLVTADTQQLAVEVANTAERYRKKLALEWLGKELPRWQQPCPVRAFVSPQYGAGGETSFAFDTRGGRRGRPMFSHMKVYGPRQRVLDSVVPHEVLHTVFATYFGCPLPRWADEGACTTVEHASERGKQDRLLVSFLSNVPSRGIAFNRMFMMTEYPPDMMPIYSQGYSLARYLIAQGGKQKFVRFVVAGMGLHDAHASSGLSGKRENRQQVLARWNAAAQKYYAYKHLSDLQVTWLNWVAKGSPAVQPRRSDAVAQVDNQEPSKELDDLVDVIPRKSAPRTAGSWYLRQRELAKVASAETSEAPIAADVPAEPFQPGSIKDAPSVNEILTRPRESRRTQVQTGSSKSYLR